MRLVISWLPRRVPPLEFRQRKCLRVGTATRARQLARIMQRWNAEKQRGCETAVGPLEPRVAALLLRLAQDAA